jgi:hypothetical protein
MVRNSDPKPFADHPVHDRLCRSLEIAANLVYLARSSDDMAEIKAYLKRAEDELASIRRFVQSVG